MSGFVWGKRFHEHLAFDQHVDTENLIYARREIFIKAGARFKRGFLLHRDKRFILAFLFIAFWEGNFWNEIRKSSWKQSLLYSKERVPLKVRSSKTSKTLIRTTRKSSKKIKRRSIWAAVTVSPNEVFNRVYLTFSLKIVFIFAFHLFLTEFVVGPFYVEENL